MRDADLRALLATLEVEDPSTTHVDAVWAEMERLLLDEGTLDIEARSGALPGPHGERLVPWPRFLAIGAAAAAVVLLVWGIAQLVASGEGSLEILPPVETPSTTVAPAALVTEIATADCGTATADLFPPTGSGEPTATSVEPIELCAELAVLLDGTLLASPTHLVRVDGGVASRLTGWPCCGAAWDEPVDDLSGGAVVSTDDGTLRFQPGLDPVVLLDDPGSAVHDSGVVNGRASLTVRSPRQSVDPVPVLFRMDLATGVMIPILSLGGDEFVADVGHGGNLWVVNVATAGPTSRFVFVDGGGTEVALEHNPRPAPVAAGAFGSPVALSPDDSALAYSVERPDTSTEVVVIDLASGAVTGRFQVVPPGTADASRPSGRPDFVNRIDFGEGRLTVDIWVPTAEPIPDRAMVIDLEARTITKIDTAPFNQLTLLEPATTVARIDWSTDATPVDLGDGRSLRCAPMGCNVVDTTTGETLGTIMATRFPLDSFTFLDPEADDATNLAAVAADHHASFAARELQGPEPFEFGGRVGMSYSLVELAEDGSFRAIDLRYIAIDGESLVMIALNAIPASEIAPPDVSDAETFFAVETLNEFRPILDTLVQASDLPPA